MLPKNNLPSLEEALDVMALWISGYRPSKTLQRFEIRIQPVDMIGWLAHQNAAVKIYGSNHKDTRAIAGIGEALCVQGQRIGSLPKIFKQLRAHLSVGYPYLQWYGGFCFDDRFLSKAWQDFGAYRFVIPRFELAAHEGRMIFCCNMIGDENVRDLVKQCAGLGCVPEDVPRTKLSQYPQIKRRDLPNKKMWDRNIARVLAEPALPKIVLARQTTLFFEQKPDAWGMLKSLKALTPNSYHFAFQFKKDVFLGASPERLFCRQGLRIESQALAGTLPSSLAPQALRRSKKNNYEHALVVDFIHEVLNPLCLTLSQDKSPKVLTLSNGHHLSTQFQGYLKDGIADEDVLKCLHPTPALGGTPRKRALALIARLESFSRGWYGAPLGYVGFEGSEFVVGIRSGLVQGKKLSVFAGAGIVQGSEAKAEWDEIENKISNFLKIMP